MPYFMDLHVVPGITPEMVAAAHKEDIRVQDEFGCRCATYWVDVERERAFCLIEAPNREAINKMHRKSLGVEPLEVIEVSEAAVTSFLGRIKDPDTFYTEGKSDLKIFNDPAFRIILVTDSYHNRLLELKLGKIEAKKLLSEYRSTIKSAIKNSKGKEVKGEEFVVSFTSVFKAVECALSIKNKTQSISKQLNLKISLHAGLPIAKDKSLFGEVVNFARFFGNSGAGEQIIMSPIIRELYKKEYENLMKEKGVKCMNSSEENFAKQLMQTLHKNWQNSEFAITDFCKSMSMSKSQFFRRSKSITGKSPNVLLQEFRLHKALQLLNEPDRNISQTAFDSGFNSLSYFTKCFRKHFGIQPTAFLKG
ncbi:MAG: nickel-binding protein [Saonia sp.]